MKFHEFAALVFTCLALLVAIVATQDFGQDEKPVIVDEKDGREVFEEMMSFHGPPPKEWLTVSNPQHLTKTDTKSAFLVPFVPEPNVENQWQKLRELLHYDIRNLRRSFDIVKRNYLLGEPILVRFAIELDGEGAWARNDWSYHNNRDETFVFLMRDSDGNWVSNRYHPVQFYYSGGTIAHVVYSRENPEIHRLALQQYCAITQPGDYELFCIRVSQRVHRSQNFPVSPLLELIPKEAVIEASKYPFVNVEYVKDFARFSITVKQGSKSERQEMVRTSTNYVLQEKQHYSRHEKGYATVLAWEHSMFSDFVPSLYDWGRQYRDESKYPYELFEPPVASVRWLGEHVTQSEAGIQIPEFIDDLSSPDATTRALSEFHLRRWTGNSINHSWSGYQPDRPTLAEGKVMQIDWLRWWDTNRSNFYVDTVE
ncbi:hypothetical protein OAF98_03925 [Planctomicrobium sp.]|jgi:hypothetical protein|nr:hypothetical protein [Planctomicrobium sp.]MBT5018276.1 hypothetical protein [Planctomicrobium sp.]MDB4743611.1 hypothetical protein [Planctomicrobium sp.]